MSDDLRDLTGRVACVLISFGAGVVGAIAIAIALPSRPCVADHTYATLFLILAMATALAVGCNVVLTALVRHVRASQTQWIPRAIAIRQRAPRDTERRPEVPSAPEAR